MDYLGTVCILDSSLESTIIGILVNMIISTTNNVIDLEWKNVKSSTDLRGPPALSAKAFMARVSRRNSTYRFGPCLTKTIFRIK